MFGIGGPELIVIAVLALILVGPEQLPKVVKTVGTGLRDLRRAANLAQAELRETMDELVREVEADPPPSPSAKAAAAAADDARRKVAEAVAQANAQAQAQPGIKRDDGQPLPPFDAALSTAGETSLSAADDVTGAMGRGVVVAAHGVAESAPARSAVEAAAASEYRARRRREIGELLAAEAAKLQQQRAQASEAEALAPWTAEAPAALPKARSDAAGDEPPPPSSSEVPAVPEGVSGTVARRAAVARPGSPAAALAQTAAAQPTSSAGATPAAEPAGEAKSTLPGAMEELG